MTISIIIPTYNEQENISELITHLQQNAGNQQIEIIVVDGDSCDDTLKKAQSCGVTCIVSEKKGRAAQMNTGAKNASGKILYFVHADAIPPTTYVPDILSAIDQGYESGCYRFRFDSDHPLLKINAFMTRFDRIMCRGGDQTLFITSTLFEKLNGYKNDFIIMEDYDLIERIQDSSSFKIIPKNVIVSSRKYHNNGYFKVQIANFIVFMMYFLNCSQETMLHTYKQLLHHPKF